MWENIFTLHTRCRISIGNLCSLHKTNNLMVPMCYIIASVFQVWFCLLCCFDFICEPWCVIWFSTLVYLSFTECFFGSFYNVCSLKSSHHPWVKWVCLLFSGIISVGKGIFSFYRRELLHLFFLWFWFCIFLWLYVASYFRFYHIVICCCVLTSSILEGWIFLLVIT